MVADGAGLVGAGCEGGWLIEEVEIAGYGIGHGGFFPALEFCGDGEFGIFPGCYFFDE